MPDFDTMTGEKVYVGGTEINMYTSPSLDAAFRETLVVAQAKTGLTTDIDAPHSYVVQVNGGKVIGLSVVEGLGH